MRWNGFNIKCDGLFYKLTDKIELDIEPSIISNIDETIEDIERTIETAVVRYEATVPPRLVDNLIRYGNDGTKGKEFESTVADYFTYLGYDTTYLGQGRGRVADVLARYKDQNFHKSYALIVDAKASSTQYSFPTGDVRKMKEYIMNHGMDLLTEHIPNHAFSFASSSFISSYEIKLNEIATETSVNGCCIEVGEMLQLADLVRKGDINISELYNSYTTNEIFKCS